MIGDPKRRRVGEEYFSKYSVKSFEAFGSNNFSSNWGCGRKNSASLLLLCSLRREEPHNNATKLQLFSALLQYYKLQVGRETNEIIILQDVEHRLS